MERLQASSNGHFLVTESGQPFFWLGDTAWELFHRLTRAEAELYLENRRQKGFTVIQAVALAEFDGLHTPNAYGHLPLVNDDPLHPNEAYFEHVDFVIRQAAARDLYIGLLPTWGDKVNKIWGIGPEVFNSENARNYGNYLGQRYRDDPNVVWILGGDRPAEGYATIWEAMADGITAGLGRHALTTYHPWGGAGSSQWFPNTPWLDIYMWQSGHMRPDIPNWEMISQDYLRNPVKPVLDGEANYEDHPINPFTRAWNPTFGRFSDYDVRKQAYRAVFSGACGHTYGHHTIWQFGSPQHEPVNHPAFDWHLAIDRPGAYQVGYLRRLMLSRPYLERIPDQDLLVASEKNAANQAEGCRHVRATRAADGSYAMIYIPTAGQSVEIDLNRLAGPLAAWWFSPRYAEAFLAGEYPANGTARFTTPETGPDWVLVLDEARRQFAHPDH